jgi:hypothetical protein
MHLILTSTCIRRLFFCGTNEVGIEKIRISENFFKAEKAAPVQVRCPTGSGGESESYKGD